MDSKEEEWKRLVRDIAECRRCPLHSSRRNPVPGEGNLSARVMLIGEAPGEKEDLSGRPFVGPAGKLLNKLLDSIGLRREDVFITNVVKCRPPQNREPKKDEIQLCLPFLRRQILLVSPEVVVTLGRVSTSTIFSLSGLKFKSIMSVRGRVLDVELFGRRIRLLPTLHPAAALYNPRVRKYLEEDFRLLKRLLEGDVPRQTSLEDF